MPGSVEVNPTQPALAEPEGRATPIWDRYPKSQRLAINFTLRCNIACAHCIVESSPYRRETLTGDEVRTALLDGKRRGKRHVTFSGGEVFLHAPLMCEVIAFATEHGYVVDVETNAFWAKTADTAARRLKPFVDAGISGLSLSADAYHVKYFPVDRPINAARAARSHGLVTEMNFCPSSEADVDAGIVAALNEAGEPYIYNELLDRGRGRDLVQIGEARAVEELPDCDSLTRTVHATADVYACCELDISTDAMKRTPVFLGSLRGDDETLTQQDDREHLVNEFYNPASPIYFRTMVQTHPRFADLADRRFHNICDFCMRALGDPERVAALADALAERPKP